jgi:hypothetical protein
MAVVEHALRRGPLYQSLLTRAGTSATGRSGSVELRGGYQSLSIIVNIDDAVWSHVGDEWYWANRLELQCNRTTLEGEDAVNVASRVLISLTRELQPAFAAAYCSAEFAAKHMHTEGGVVKAIGVDASRWVLGPFWITVFGQPYVDFFGRERLLTCHARRVESLGEAIWIQIHERPEAWNTDRYRGTQSAVVSHLGARVFFSRTDPNSANTRPQIDLGFVHQR